jgi:hypothetical protein
VMSWWKTFKTVISAVRKNQCVNVPENWDFQKQQFIEFWKKSTFYWL